MNNRLFMLYMRDIQVTSFSGARTNIKRWADRRLMIFFAVSLVCLLSKMGGEYAAEIVHEKVKEYQQRSTNE